MTFDRHTVARVAVALSLVVAGACYDLTPVPVPAPETDAGSSCTGDMAAADAGDECPPSEAPDAGEIDAGADDAAASMDQQSEAPQ